MRGYFLVLSSVVLLALNFIVVKIYQQKTDTSVKSRALFSVYASLCMFAFFFVANGFSLQISPYSLLNALVRAACAFAYVLIGYRVIAQGSMALYTLFLMSGGMLVPTVVGWLFLDEAVTPLRLLGVVLIVAAITLNNSGMTRPRLRVILWCVLIFLLNGLVSVFSKLHQIHTAYGAVGTTDYMLISAVFTMMMGLGTVCFPTKRESCAPPRPKRYRWLALVIAAVSSVMDGLSSFLQLEGAKSLPASVLYPMVTGGSIVLTALFALLFFGERLTKKEWIGIGICMAGTCCFL